MKYPLHIAFIMDGNGRWAERKGLPRFVGHSQGVKVIKKLPDICHHKQKVLQTKTLEFNQRVFFKYMAFGRNLADKNHKIQENLDNDEICYRVKFGWFPIGGKFSDR